MDHRWDESTLQDRAARAEAERLGGKRIERDPDVERRDELLLEEKRRHINQSPWSVGTAFYDQRDTYTRNAEIDASGYGHGPSYHPAEGSYAYHRDSHPSFNEVRGSDASLYEKEAWPWLVYKETTADPYFAHLHDAPPSKSLWQRVKALFARAVGYRVDAEYRSDARIKADIADALWFRGDLDASEIEVSASEGEVTLEGTVTDRRSKYIAGEVVRGVRGVRDVHNRLKIQREDSGDAGVGLVPAI